MRFDPFVVDLRAYELRKHGVRIKLRQQSFQILQMLLESPGEVVLRDEIRERLWPNDTVVEFEHSINASVQKLRDALGESAENPRFIETVKGRGYRFLGTVEALSTEPSRPEPLATATMSRLEAEQAPLAAGGWRRRAWWIAGIVCLAGFAGMLLWKQAAPSRELKRVFQLGQYSNPILSPDGTWVAYRTERGLLARRLDTMTEITLNGPRRQIDQPAWSPDSRRIVYPTHEALVSVPVGEGVATVIPRPAGPTRGLSWGENGKILVAYIDFGTSRGRLSLVSAMGENAMPLELPGFINGIFHYPQILPGGEDFLFTWSAEGDPETKLYLARIRNGRAAGAPVLLIANTGAASYSGLGGGRLLFVKDDKLYAQRLNLAAGRLEGEPKVVVDGVFSTPGYPMPYFSASDTGVLTWRSGKTDLGQLHWFDRQGRDLGSVGPACAAGEIRLFKDDRHVLLWTTSGQSFVVTDGKDGWTQLAEISPRGTPDTMAGEAAQHGGVSGPFQIPLDAASYRNWRGRVALGSILDFSPDRKSVLIKSSDWSLRSANLEDAPDTSKHKRVYQPRETVLTARFSPDGKWIVYASRDKRLPSAEVHIQPFPSAWARKQISAGGGNYPVWREDGREIVYLWEDKIYSVALKQTGGDIHADPPGALFAVRTPAFLNGGSQPLAITRDGSRILFVQALEQPLMSYVMTAWDAGLER